MLVNLMRRTSLSAPLRGYTKTWAMFTKHVYIIKAWRIAILSLTVYTAGAVSGFQSRGGGRNLRNCFILSQKNTFVRISFKSAMVFSWKQDCSGFVWRVWRMSWPARPARDPPAPQSCIQTRALSILDYMITDNARVYIWSSAPLSCIQTRALSLLYYILFTDNTKLYIYIYMHC